MKPERKLLLPKGQKGVVLLEALIAILIFSIGILGAVGLQASMIKANADAKYRAEAGFIAEQRISKLWVDQEALRINARVYDEPSPGTDISADSGLPNGRRVTSACANGDPSCFQIIVSWQQPGVNETHQLVTIARVTGG